MGSCEPHIESYGDQSRHKGLSGEITLVVTPSLGSDLARALTTVLVFVDLQLRRLARNTPCIGPSKIGARVARGCADCSISSSTVAPSVFAHCALLTPTFVRPHARVVLVVYYARVVSMCNLSRRLPGDEMRCRSDLVFIRTSYATKHSGFPACMNTMALTTWLISPPAGARTPDTRNTCARCICHNAARLIGSFNDWCQGGLEGVVSFTL